MGLGCTGTIAKYILFLINFVVFACGAALLGVGIALVVDDEAIGWITDITGGGDMNDDLFQAAVYMMLAIGGLLFVVGFFGCCGAYKENSCLLMMYIICVCVLLACQIAAGILGAVYKSSIDEVIQTQMYTSVQDKYYKEDTTTTAWDHMQYDWQCCGSYNETDYIDSFFYMNTTNAVPGSCCAAAYEENDEITILPDDYVHCLDAVNNKTGDSNVYYEKGCYQSFNEWVEENSNIIMGVMFGLAGVQFIGLLFACSVKGSLNKVGSG